MIRNRFLILVLGVSLAAFGCGDDSGGGGTAGSNGGSGGAQGGAGGNGGTPTGGAGGTFGDPDAQTQTVSVACANSITAQIAILDWELTVDPEEILANQSFNVTADGVAAFSEAFLDIALNVISGLMTVQLNDVAATVVPRAGATADGAPLVLGPEPIQATCVIEGTCDPANDQPDGSNTDCVPVGDFNPCARFVELPTIDDEAMCDALGETKATQFDNNGFCIGGPLNLPLEEATGSFTAAANGDVLFGWDESAGTVIEDGTFMFTMPLFGDPTPPVGLRVTAGALAVALQCGMGVDSNGPDGVGVEDQSSPTPDSGLLSFPIGGAIQ